MAARLDSADLCYGHGTDNSLDEAFYLIYGLLGIDFADEQAAQRELSVGEEAMLETALTRRIDERVPTAYLVGRAWFAGHEFYSDERALVPRSPIAELINGQFEPLLHKPAGKILDICTGGGSIGIAIALLWPDSEVDLADISADALDLAKKNIALHGLGSRVRAIESDLFDDIDSRYDLIVANPPYVPVQEYDELPAEFAREPSLGLISADDGLQIPLKILRDSVDYLSVEGLLVMEVGYSHPQLSERLKQVPLLWLEFEQGGEGVLALTARQLQQYREQFN
ncbi:MAG: 50S ribosomal protein L3 N(5)-glutamine methyltransferase [SAR86 cluster bacterium]|uniref:50S ribosomal protein L3 N(5)-glutamine methyltransferase n=1 Tax=SAR86 cluster bacterium TaxID=2030880 RepID=A0A2A4XAC3_9GAMM|nr:MAG: 50S ribosomal protein L3 N(5)-glutamine methyltransferase [SAR86 cluster bacterium]